MTNSSAAQRSAIVTGATSGIGTAISRMLYEQGYHVLLSGRSATKGEQLAESFGRRARFFAADLTEAGAAGRVVEEALAFAGRVDVLVNNAAIDYTEDLLQSQMEDVRRVFEANTFAPLAMLQAAAAAMKDTGSGGSIVNITSRLASVGVPSMGIYAASKGALLALTKSAAVELAPYNIRVNAVAPGMTRTRLYEKWLAGLPDPGFVEEQVTSGIPLGRIAEAVDVAAAVAFLASEQAAYLTGTSIPVDGGYTAT
jgi:NAD(P)-dependent dehydrogenase (short-subunit alcohol dehydrogenase family)